MPATTNKVYLVIQSYRIGKGHNSLKYLESNSKSQILSLAMYIAVILVSVSVVIPSLTITTATMNESWQCYSIAITRTEIYLRERYSIELRYISDYDG